MNPFIAFLANLIFWLIMIDFEGEHKGPRFLQYATGSFGDVIGLGLLSMSYVLLFGSITTHLVVALIVSAGVTFLLHKHYERWDSLTTASYDKDSKLTSFGAFHTLYIFLHLTFIFAVALSVFFSSVSMGLGLIIALVGLGLYAVTFVVDIVRGVMY